MVVLIIVIFFIQVLGILWLHKSWSFMRSTDSISSVSIPVSIVIAYRNELHHLETLCKCLNQQNYNPDLLEIILVNDHSDDESVTFLNRFSFKFKSKLLHLPKEVCGKKNAIRLGVQNSENELVITTDADCMLQENWVNVIANFYHRTHANLIAAPVAFHSDSTLWQDMQQIEFSSLIGVTGALIAKGSPVMCNAANLAFNRWRYLELYDSNEDTVSGDDVFLMHQIHSKYPGTVRFLKSKMATVYTTPNLTLSDFIQQRIRWASKWSLYTDVYTKATAVLVWSVNLLFLFLPFILPITMSIFIVVCKALAEYVFLRKVLLDAAVKIKFFAFLCLIFLYPVYVVFIGLLSLNRNYRWKGRIVK